MPTTLIFWICRAEGWEFTPHAEATQFGVVGCHKYAPHLYDPLEYDDDHNDCCWARVTLMGGI